MPKALFLAFANPTSPEDEAEFNRWYEKHHVTDLLREIDQISAATRYRITDVQVLPGGPTLGQKYLTVYEIEAENEADLERIAQALRDTMGSGVVGISPTLDIANSVPVLALPISERRTS